MIKMYRTALFLAASLLFICNCKNTACQFCFLVTNFNGASNLIYLLTAENSGVALNAFC